METAAEIEKSLYICSTVLLDDGLHRYVIHAIKLRDLSMDDDDDDDDDSSSATTKLQKYSSTGDKYLPAWMGCGVWGSQILLAGGFERTPGASGRNHSKQIHVFETDSTKNPNPNIMYDCFANFQNGKATPFLVEVDGNLYALSADCLDTDHSFEVFHWNSGRWFTLQDLPLSLSFQPDPNYSNTYFTYAVAGTKIMVSSPKHPVYCFDVAMANLNLSELLKEDWRMLNSMCSGGPFPFQGRALVLDLEDDDEYIMFSYQFVSEDIGWAIVADRIFNESSQRIQVLHPPELSTTVLPTPEFMEPLMQHSFAHLGGRKVCLVIADFTWRKIDQNVPICERDCGMEKMRFLVTTFEFSFSKLAKETTAHAFSAQFLACPTFEYDLSQESSINITAQLLGCFVPSKLTSEYHTQGPCS